MNITDIYRTLSEGGELRDKPLARLRWDWSPAVFLRTPPKNGQLMHWWWVDLCDEHFHGHNWLNVKILQQKIRQYELCFLKSIFLFGSIFLVITVIVLKMSKKCFSVFSGASPAEKKRDGRQDLTKLISALREIEATWSETVGPSEESRVVPGGKPSGPRDSVPGWGFSKDFWGHLEFNQSISIKVILWITLPEN